MAKTTHAAPVLKDEGILGKPASYKEKAIDEHIQHTMQMLDDNPHIEEVSINLSNFYASYQNQVMPAIDDPLKKIMRESISNLTLVIKQPRRKPRRAFLKQVLVPCPYGAVKSFAEGVRASLVPFAEQERTLYYGESEVRQRLGVEMDFDVTKPHREQVLRFSEEAGFLEQQYCIYQGNDDQETDPNV
jgi:hypothetical protein